MVGDWIAGERGGHVWTVDLNPGGEALVDQLGLRHVTALVGDSLRILPELNPGLADLLYLDSLELDWLDCVPSALHHLRELQAARHLLASGSIFALRHSDNSSSWIEFPSFLPSLTFLLFRYFTHDAETVGCGELRGSTLCRYRCAYWAGPNRADQPRLVGMIRAIQGSSPSFASVSSPSSRKSNDFAWAHELHVQ